MSKLPVGQPRVAPGGHRWLTGWTNTHDEHWPGGDNIKMTLESATPKGKRLGEANVKPRLGLAGRVLFKANYQGGPINPQPHKERKIKEHNTGMMETRAARVEQNTRHKA